MSTQPFLPADWDLPKSLYYRLGYGPGRQRVLEQDDHVLLVLHDPPAHLDRDRTGRLFWIQPEGEWRASYSNDGQQALERHLDRYEKRIDKLSEQLEAANDSEHYFATLGELGPLVRSTNNLSQALQEARKLRKEDRLLMEARDRAYALHRRVDLLQQDAKNSLDYEMAKQAESQAKSSHQMAVSRPSAQHASRVFLSAGNPLSHLRHDVYARPGRLGPSHRPTRFYNLACHRIASRRRADRCWSPDADIVMLRAHQFNKH